MSSVVGIDVGGTFTDLVFSADGSSVERVIKAIRKVSGGNGAKRGGCGTRYGIETLSDCLVSVLGDQVDSSPFGAMGGQPAAPNEIRFNRLGEDWLPPLPSKADKVQCALGDVIHLASPGCGGFGDPAEREQAEVIADLNAGLIDAQTAERVQAEILRIVMGRPVYAREQMVQAL